MAALPADRIQVRNDAPIREDGAFVLYWMIAARRRRWNGALQYAVARARELGRPLVVLEPLRCGYRWASPRFHRFLIEGMRANREAFDDTAVTYHPYVEPEAGAGKGLIQALAEHACLIVTDEPVTFFLPRLVDAAARLVSVRLETYDGNGLIPLRAPDKTFARAFDYRRFVHANLADHLGGTPKQDPLARVELPKPVAIPKDVRDRWPAADIDALLEPGGLDQLPLDARVGPVDLEGGASAGDALLRAFLRGAFPDYADARGQVDVASGLSPYLHFGHVGAHQVFDRIVKAEDWSVDRIQPAKRGAREGWWGLSPSAEAFLDQLVTWRELGAQSAFRRADFGTWGGLPEWARRSLEEHADDPRPHLYEFDAFDRAATHDEIWNAAQRQLRREGKIENYLRMLWGKKILHWSRTPQEAFATTLELNQRYALDGRDPNSDSGIGWVFGLFDRPWGPKREVFGSIRYMTSDSTRRKLKLGPYLERFGPEGSLFEA